MELTVKSFRSLWLDRGARWLLATVFLYAGTPKLVDPVFFSKIIGAYGILPASLVFPAAVFLPIVELIAAVLLLWGRKEGLWLAASLMLAFIGVLSYGIYLGLDIDCGCFGPGDPEHIAFSGLHSALIRDLLLCIPLLYGFWFNFHRRYQHYGERS